VRAFSVVTGLELRRGRLGNCCFMGVMKEFGLRREGDWEYLMYVGLLKELVRGS
jgi:hypothetical protein